MPEVIFVPDRVIDGSLPEPLEEVAVVVGEDRITELVSTNLLTKRRLDEALVVDGSGMTLMPGLIDCHVHLVFDRYTTMQAIDQGSLEAATLVAAKNAALLLRHGYTTVRDVGSRGSASLAVARGVREGLIEGPRVLAGAELITTTAGTADSYQPWITNSAGVGVVVDGVDALRQEVRRQAKLGASHVKLGLSGSEPSVFSFTWMTTMSEEEVSTAIAEAHRLGLRVACHSEAEESSQFAARHGADTIEHGTRLVEEAAAAMLATGTVLVPTLCTLHSVLRLGEELRLGEKQRLEMEANERPWLDSVLLAHEMKVPIAAGGDVGNRYRQGQNAKEIGFLRDAGLSEMEALQAATSVAATALGLGEVVGRLESGYQADLVLLRGNPLEDLTLLEDASNFEAVMRAGQWSSETKDRLTRRTLRA